MITRTKLKDLIILLLKEKYKTDFKFDDNINYHHSNHEVLMNRKVIFKRNFENWKEIYLVNFLENSIH